MDVSNLNATEAAVFAVANNVAQKYATHMTYSSFHVWEFLQRHASLDRATQVSQYVDMMETQPLDQSFGTCVDFAYYTTRDLRAALAETPGLEMFARKVQYRTSYMESPVREVPCKLTHAQDNSANNTVELRKMSVEEKETIYDGYFPKHPITVLRLQNSIVVIDAMASPTAFLIPINGYQDSPKRWALSGKQRVLRFRYCDFLETSGRPTLLMGFWSDTEDVYRWGEVRKAHYRAAVECIQFSNASMIALEVSGNKTFAFPVDKYVITKRILPEAPQHIPSTQLPDGYWAEGITLSISFKRKSILMQIPAQENSVLADRLKRLQVKMKDSKSPSYIMPILCLDEAGEPGTAENHFQVFAEIAEQFGVDKALFTRICKTVKEYKPELYHGSMIVPRPLP
jgi:hypothetical protein